MEAVDVAVQLDIAGGERRGIDARAADGDHAQPRHEPARRRLAPPATCSQQMRADARAAHRDEADLLVLAPAELAPQRRALGRAWAGRSR